MWKGRQGQRRGGHVGRIWVWLFYHLDLPEVQWKPLATLQLGRRRTPITSATMYFLTCAEWQVSKQACSQTILFNYPHIRDEVDVDMFIFFWLSSNCMNGIGALTKVTPEGTQAPSTI